MTQLQKIINFHSKEHLSIDDDLPKAPLDQGKKSQSKKTETKNLSKPAKVQRIVGRIWC
ncbi:MAG: hypothetical protein F6K14_27065 [Symploca sp. SIO2C1]|nr:hypothetical protein [Symploca sp. SIO2C1]